jgi:hypothetical protein
MSLALSISLMVVVYYIADWLFKLPSLINLIIAFLVVIQVEKLVGLFQSR